MDDCQAADGGGGPYSSFERRNCQRERGKGGGGLGVSTAFWREREKKKGKGFLWDLTGQEGTGTSNALQLLSKKKERLASTMEGEREITPNCQGKKEEKGVKRFCFPAWRKESGPDISSLQGGRGNSSRGKKEKGGKKKT